jgi:hypothetical protein
MTKKRVQQREQGITEVCPGMAHRTVRCVTGQCPVHHRTVSGVLGHSRLNSSPLGKTQRRSTIIHRTVRCTTEQCPVPQGRATLNSPASDFCSARRGVEHARVAHRTVYRTCPVHHRTARRAHKSELQRSEPNGLVTWLAHRTVSGGALDCPVRHAIGASTKRLVWWLGL